MRIRVPTFLYLFLSILVGNPPPKKGKRALLGDLDTPMLIHNPTGEATDSREKLLAPGVRERRLQGSSPDIFAVQTHGCEFEIGPFWSEMSRALIIVEMVLG